jgi:hypothetical protein
MLTKHQLTRYFQEVSPTHVDVVDDILEDYENRESELVADLTAKYKKSPLDFPSGDEQRGKYSPGSIPPSPGRSVYVNSPSKPSFLDAHPSARYDQRLQFSERSMHNRTVCCHRQKAHYRFTPSGFDEGQRGP